MEKGVCPMVTCHGYLSEHAADAGVQSPLFLYEFQQRLPVAGIRRVNRGCEGWHGLVGHLSLTYRFVQPVW